MHSAVDFACGVAMMRCLEGPDLRGLMQEQLLFLRRGLVMHMERLGKLPLL